MVLKTGGRGEREREARKKSQVKGRMQGKERVSQQEDASTVEVSSNILK